MRKTSNFNPPLDLAGKLKKLREYRNLTLASAVSGLSISKSHLSKLENAQIGMPRGSLVRELSEVYGCSTDTLLNRRTDNFERQCLLDELIEVTCELDSEQIKRLLQYVSTLRLERAEQEFLENLPDVMKEWYKTLTVKMKKVLLDEVRMSMRADQLK